MDFAPYQSESPDHSRKSLNLTRPMSPPQSPPPHITGMGYQGGGSGGGGYPAGPSSSSGLRSPPLLPTHQPGGGWPTDRMTVGQFETSLPIRLDFEAALAYLILPPAAGVLLLITEHKSDYVRFHAWQSSLVFAFLVVVHLVLSFSSFLSYTLLTIDLVLMLYMAGRAYRDADTLDRCELPFFGPLASGIVDDE